MKSLRYILLLCSCIVYAERYKVDFIKVTIYGEQDTLLITQSEALRPGLDGQPKQFEDLVFEHLVFLDAQRIGGAPTITDIDKHWEDVKKQNNLSELDMQRIAAQAGYTVPEAKEQLGRMSAINQMFDFKVRSGLFVTQREVEAYYHEHPEITEAEYAIARAVVPFSDLESKEDMRHRLETFVTTGKGNVRLAWSEPFWIKHDHVAQDKQFIYEMKIGDVSMPVEITHGFELFKLVNKKSEQKVPLQERYDEIATLLKRPKYEQLLEAYKKDLFDKATIVYHE